MLAGSLAITSGFLLQMDAIYDYKTGTPESMFLLGLLLISDLMLAAMAVGYG
jgi:hypothetical protein